MVGTADPYCGSTCGIAASKVICMWGRELVYDSKQGQGLFFLPSCLNWLRGPPSFLTNRYWGLLVCG